MNDLHIIAQLAFTTEWIDGIDYYGYQDEGSLYVSCAMDKVKEESAKAQKDYQSKL